MADEILFPTWKDFEIPSQFVDMIKNLQSDNLLEQLIYEKVFHKTRLMQYVYTCGVCGHEHKPEKSVEDYSTCESCDSRAITATQYLRGWNRVYPSGCSNTDMFAQDVLSKMHNNFLIYFAKNLDYSKLDDFVVIRWKYHNKFTVKYLGGDQAEDQKTAKAICKASLLVPFLWDTNFDWKTNSKKMPGKHISISPTIYEWIQRGNNQ